MALTTVVNRSALLKTYGILAATPLLMVPYAIQAHTHSKVLQEVVNLSEKSAKLSKELKKEKQNAKAVHSLYVDTQDELVLVRRELEDTKKGYNTLLTSFGVGVISFMTLAAITFHR